MFVTCQTELFYRLESEVENQLTLHPNLPRPLYPRNKVPFARVNMLHHVTEDCKEKFNGILGEMEALLQYTNTCLSTSSSLYGKNGRFLQVSKELVMNLDHRITRSNLPMGAPDGIERATG